MIASRETRTPTSIRAAAMVFVCLVQCAFVGQTLGRSQFGSLLVASTSVANWRCESELCDEQDTETVKLTIEFGESRPKRVIENIEWREDMTVYDVMNQARRIDKEFAFRHRGSRDTLFILAIEGVENEGARGDNWIFRVNDKLGDRSCGIYPVEAGQHVIWRFGEYKQN